MPTYEYVCDACEHAFEKFQSIKASPIKVCPECGLRKVRRLIGTGAGIIFKGSGFYQTDYRSEGYRKAASADSSGGSASDSSASSSASSSSSESTSSPAKSDSKPAGGSKAAG